jgi:hypothetical protein
VSSEPMTINIQSQMSADDGLTVRDLLIQASKAGATLYNGQPVSVLLEDPDNEAELSLKANESAMAHQGVLRQFPVPKKLLVILNWKMRSQYREVPASMTLGGLNALVQEDVKRVLGGRVRKYEFQITGTSIRPDPETPLLNLTHYPARNICLDVLREGELGPVPTPQCPSVNEHLLRKHLTRGRFQNGVDQGLWRLVTIRWPEAVFAVRRKEHRRGSHEALIRFQLDKYPQSAPVIDLWNVDRQSNIEPIQWPNWFRNFVVRHYPSFAVIEPATYSPALLQISEAIARRLKEAESEPWDSSGDITQCLIGLLTCFRSDSSDVNSFRQSSAQPNSQRPLYVSRSRRRKKIEKIS